MKCARCLFSYMCAHGYGVTEQASTPKTGNVGRNTADRVARRFNRRVTWRANVDGAIWATIDRLTRSLVHACLHTLANLSEALNQRTFYVSACRSFYRITDVESSKISESHTSIIGLVTFYWVWYTDSHTAYSQVDNHSLPTIPPFPIAHLSFPLPPLKQS